MKNFLGSSNSWQLDNDYHDDSGCY